MDNLFPTLTNLSMLLPIYSAYINADIITFNCIVNVFIASSVFHLVENHKHCMQGGIKVSKYASYIWNVLDLIGVSIVITRFVYLYYTYFEIIHIRPIEYTLVVFSLIICALSEIGQNNPKLKYILYIPLHSLWHIMAGILMNMFLNKIY
jgi:hypothetical protein